jgi:hypothetical protein
LTKQTAATHKLLSTLAGQQTELKDVNELTREEIQAFIETQFDPKRFIVRERFKFWSEMQRKPGETIQELAARIRQGAVKYDFSAIKDPQDDAMRTRFMCSVSNEAVLKALFKVSDDELTFTKAIQIAVETEDAAKVAKETVHGAPRDTVLAVRPKPGSTCDNGGTNEKKKGQGNSPFPPEACPRCAKTGHSSQDCRFKNAVCRSCGKKGHIYTGRLLGKANSLQGGGSEASAAFAHRDDHLPEVTRGLPVAGPENQ